MKLNKIILLITLGTISCSFSKDDIAKKKIEAQLLMEIKDPKSYEFLSIDTLKPFTLLDSMELEKRLFQTKIDAASMISEVWLELLKNDPKWQFSHTDSVELEESYAKILILKAEEIENNKNINEKSHDITFINDIIGYQTKLFFRHFKKGKLVLDSTYVFLDKDLNRVSLAPRNYNHSLIFSH
jgi:hypothetical protein